MKCTYAGRTVQGEIDKVFCRHQLVGKRSLVESSTCLNCEFREIKGTHVAAANHHCNYLLDMIAEVENGCTACGGSDKIYGCHLHGQTVKFANQLDEDHPETKTCEGCPDKQ